MNTRIVWKWGNYRQNFADLRSEYAALNRAEAERVAAACNAESSWGGYYVHHDNDRARPRSVVVVAHPTSDRIARLLRHLSGGQ